jgi:uncharacterized protein (DUF2062 family)
MRIAATQIRYRLAQWLRQGISPRRLALTLALGFAVGCLPVVGLPTALCVVLAIVLRLNLPAIQAANYVVMPLQLVLIAPFVRLGGWLVSLTPKHAIGARILLHLLPIRILWHLATFAGQALLAWLVIALPAVALMTLVLTLVLRRVTTLANEKQVSESAGQQVSLP